MSYDAKLIKMILEELENNLKLQSHRGHGGAYALDKATGSRVYGKSIYDTEEDDYEEAVVKNNKDFKPVKVSKAFHGKHNE